MHSVMSLRTSRKETGLLDNVITELSVHHRINVSLESILANVSLDGMVYLSVM